jgi:hypothetical protein
MLTYPRKLDHAVASVFDLSGVGRSCHFARRFRTSALRLCADVHGGQSIFRGRPRLCKNAFPSYKPYEMAEEFEKRLLLVVARFDQVCVFTQPRPIAAFRQVAKLPFNADVTGDLRQKGAQRRNTASRRLHPR